jgi:hypothetical protein
MVKNLYHQFLNMVNNDQNELVILDNDKEDNSTINVEETK